MNGCPEPAGYNKVSVPRRAMGALAEPVSPTAALTSVRAAIRSGEFHGSTAGLAPDRCQANYVGLPETLAEDFFRFCSKNPSACPLIEKTLPGVYRPNCAPQADLRTDIPRYRIFREGRLISEPRSLSSEWREDLVSFLLGCSFSFEASLLNAGIPLRHHERGTRVPMFRTNKDTIPSRHFSGPLVVSMRPIHRDLVPLAVEITGAQPWAHGAPVAIGDPEELGIMSLQCPDYGDPVPVSVDEVPVFWACGVTSQAAAVAARCDFMVTHAPASMFITDLPVP